MLVTREDGAVLLVLHSGPDRWETIGGLIEPGEAPADAARREAQEEVGVEVRLGALVERSADPSSR